MTIDDQKKFSKLVCGLFPCKVTDDQARFLREQAAPLPFDLAEKFAKQYRAENATIEISEFTKGLQVIAQQEERQRSAIGREPEWTEFYREKWRPKLDNASPLEIILRVKRSEWDNPKCSKSDGIRNTIRREAASLIVRFCRVDAGESERLAELVFAADFQAVLNELRIHRPASLCA